MKWFTVVLVGFFAFAQTQLPAAEPLEISASLETPLVLETDKFAHVLVRLKANKAPGEEKLKSLNLALVIDRSGSMRGSKITDARAAAVQMLERMRDGDRVAVVSYSHDVRVDSPSVILNEAARKKVRNAIHRISDHGSTNLGGGLVKGLAEVKKHIGTSDVNRVLLISDGLANRGVKDPAELNKISRESLQHGIITTTIGLGEDYNEDLMTGVADNGGGNYYFVEKSDNIASTLNDEVRQMAQTVAKSVALHLTLPDGVKLEKVHGWLPREEGEMVIVPLGEFFSGQLRAVLWKFRLPKDMKAGQEIDLGRVELAFDGLNKTGKLTRSKSEPLKVKVSSDKDAVLAARNVEVAARIAEIELATRVENASILVSEGKFQEAQQVLSAAVADAKMSSGRLPEAAKKDLMLAAEQAEKLNRQVDEAKDSASKAKVLTKEGKASAFMLRKK